MAQGQIVQGLVRGLSVLRALNERNHATALELSRDTGLPRATIYRLLETLVRSGYVARGGRRETYRLTIQVRALSDGFTDEAWLTNVASPVLEELGQEIVWPTDIATFDRDAMIVRDTTHGTSPLSINREKAGFRPPMLLSSLGRAYLAWCPAAERDLILRTIANSAQPDAEQARDRAAVDALLAKVEKKGYGFREGGMSEKTGSIAVPVRWADRVVACINIHYILSALTESEVADRYLPAMRQAAEEIEIRMKAGGFVPPEVGGD